MKNFFKNKKILITGHTGFQGAWLAYILNKFGAKVVGVSLSPHTEPNLFTILDLKNKVKNYFVDIRDLNKLKGVFEKERPQIVFHLAAQALVRRSFVERIETYSTNVLGTTNVLESMMEFRVRSGVIITTDKVYDNNEKSKPFKEDDKLGGFDPYSASKAAADLVTSSYIKAFFNIDDYLKKHKTLLAIARSGNVIGGGDWSEDRLIPDFVRSTFGSFKPMVLRNPDSVRPWQHVFEALSGYMNLSQKLYNGDVSAVGAWNFGPKSSSFMKVGGVIKQLISLFGMGSFVIKINDNKHEAKFLTLDSSKAVRLLKWKPKLMIAQALSWTAAWYKIFYENKNEVSSFSDKQINKFFN